METFETMIKDRLEDMQSEPENELWSRILESVSNETEEPHISSVRFRKTRTSIFKLLVSAAAMIILICTLNITIVMAFVKNILFFIPGIGLGETDMSVVMLKEPVEMNCGFGKFKVEFGTKVTNEDGRCEIMMFLTTTENIYSSGAYIEDLYARAVIEGEEYILNSDGMGLGNPGGFNTAICVKNNDFPDINEFDLTFGGATARIVMTEMSKEEKTPYFSEENKGITLSMYKYRNNNRFIGFDVINNNGSGSFSYTSTKLSGLSVILYDGNGGEITLADGRLNKKDNIFESNLTNGLLYLNNVDNIDVKKIIVGSIAVDYRSEFAETPYSIIVPVPEDGETLYPENIEVSVGGTVYKITEVRREGGVIYFKDNSKSYYNEPVDYEQATQNLESYVTYIGLGDWFAGTPSAVGNKITGFNPDDASFILPVMNIQVTYYGDFTVNFEK